MADIDIDASELDSAVFSVRLLKRQLSRRDSDVQGELADDLADGIRSNVKRLFGVNEDKDDDALYNAFDVYPKGGAHRITTRNSTVDYAAALEEGISAHEIEGNPYLHFTPEDTEPYPDSSVNEDGSVTLSSVTWKPDKTLTASGYEYVNSAQKIWYEQDVRPTMDEMLIKSITSSGFK